MKRKKLLIATLFAMCSMGLQAQETVEMVYPQAEWSKAGDILMHTPGQELFNGVIHPSAGWLWRRTLHDASVATRSLEERWNFNSRTQSKRH